MHEWAILVTDALWSVQECAELKHHLMTKKKAHCKYLQSSYRYCEKWECALRKHIELKGEQGGGLKTVLCASGWAKQLECSILDAFKNTCMTLIASGVGPTKFERID